MEKKSKQKPSACGADGFCHCFIAIALAQAPNQQCLFVFCAEFLYFFIGPDGVFGVSVSEDEIC